MGHSQQCDDGGTHDNILMSGDILDIVDENKVLIQIVDIGQGTLISILKTVHRHYYILLFQPLQHPVSPLSLTPNPIAGI